MKRLSLVLAALVIPVAIGLAVGASAASDTTAPTPPAPAVGAPSPGYGPGMGLGRGQGMGPGPHATWRWGPGMRHVHRGCGHGMHHAHWGWGHGMHHDAYWGWGPEAMGPRGLRMEHMAYRADTNHDGTLTVDEVKAFLEAHDRAPWFENLKVGAVKIKNANTITADIVTKDGSLVRTLEFPRKVEVAMQPERYPFGPGMWGEHRGFGQAAARGFGRHTYHDGLIAGLLADGHLSVDEVKGLLEHRLAKWHNPHLKVGAVTEKNGTISADIVTQDGSLVEHLAFDSKTARLLEIN